MLAPRLVDAVAQGRFHIYTAERASDGMELLTGQRFGVAGARGYAPDTVLGRAQKTLQDYRRACEPLGERRPAQRLRALRPRRTARPPG